MDFHNAADHHHNHVTTDINNYIKHHYYLIDNHDDPAHDNEYGIHYDYDRTERSGKRGGLPLSPGGDKRGRGA